jgi:hypothetical protein
MVKVDEDWTSTCIQSGLSSGEGLINAIRDDHIKYNQKGEAINVRGIEDKRLLLDEREFFQALSTMKREGNTASKVVRYGWDSQPLQSLTLSTPLRVSKPHISISAHITEEELRREMDQTAMVNGYANRFLFACVKRSKELPFGGKLTQEAIDALAKEISELCTPKNFFQAYAEENETEIKMDAEASAFWDGNGRGLYHDLTNPPPGLIGAICGRADAQTLRLALLYAVLDGSREIKLVHLRAALALWKYCEDSARYVFGDSLGDPLADEILRELRILRDGMSRNEILNLLGRHQSRGKIAAALATLKHCGKARSEIRSPKIGAKPGGRPVEVWFATG